MKTFLFFISFFFCFSSQAFLKSGNLVTCEGDFTHFQFAIPKNINLYVDEDSDMRLYLGDFENLKQDTENNEGSAVFSVHPDRIDIFDTLDSKKIGTLRMKGEALELERTLESGPKKIHINCKQTPLENID